MSKQAWIVTITFHDSSTRQLTFRTKREAQAAERRAIRSPIVLFATTAKEQA